MLLDWPTHEERPLHFSLYTDQASRGKKRAPLFELDAAQQAREEMNLLYVAMTRAQQALIVGGNSKGEDKEEKKKSPSWYDRIATVVGEQLNPLHVVTPRPQAGEGSAAAREREALRQILAIPSAEIDSLWQQAQRLLTSPQLARFFDARQYRSACNEMPYVNAAGELKRIDRLVEFDDEVWVLDYKLGDSEDVARHQAQMQEYRTAMQTVYAGKTVRCALVYADGVLSEV